MYSTISSPLPFSNLGRLEINVSDDSNPHYVGGSPKRLLDLEGDSAVSWPMRASFRVTTERPNRFL